MLGFYKHADSASNQNFQTKQIPFGPSENQGSVFTLSSCSDGTEFFWCPTIPTPLKNRMAKIAAISQEIVNDCKMTLKNKDLT